MPTIRLVRHGEAAAGFGTHKDPGLSAHGQDQARQVARTLAKLAPVALYSSPLARAYETAQPLAAAWQAPIAVEPRVAEIPSPTHDLAERAAWLSQAMAGRWSDLADEFVGWRNALETCLLGYDHDCVIFSHYVAINAAVGIAQNDDRMRIFGPDNCSVTTLTNDGHRLSVVSLGVTATTKIN